MATKTTKAPKKVEKETHIEAESRNYEMVLVLQPELREAEVKKKLKEIEKIIEGSGGKITNTDEWDKQELAYPIKKFDEGLYIVHTLEMPSTSLREINDFLRIEKDVIRFLITAVSADYEYIKFDVVVEEPKKVEEKRPSKPPVVPIKTAKPAKKEDDQAGKEPDKDEVDKKLDAIIGGDDLEI